MARSAALIGRVDQHEIVTALPTADLAGEGGPRSSSMTRSAPSSPTLARCFAAPIVRCLAITFHEHDRRRHPARALRAQARRCTGVGIEHARASETSRTRLNIASLTLIAGRPVRPNPRGAWRRRPLRSPAMILIAEHSSDLDGQQIIGLAYLAFTRGLTRPLEQLLVATQDG